MINCYRNIQKFFKYVLKYLSFCYYTNIEISKTLTYKNLYKDQDTMDKQVYFFIMFRNI